MSDELNGMIVSELIRHRSRDDIIKAVCERSGLNWTQAGDLVEQVQVEQARAIARGQAPLLLAVSAGLVLGGAMLLAIFAWYAGVFMRGNTPTRWLVILTMIEYSPLLTWAGAVGVGMIAGGLAGLSGAYRQYAKH